MRGAVRAVRCARCARYPTVAAENPSILGLLAYVQCAELPCRAASAPWPAKVAKIATSQWAAANKTTRFPPTTNALRGIRQYYFRWLRHFRRPREGAPRDLRGGGLGGPGESRGALPGTSGERGWGALRGSPGELSLGPRGRRFGSSGGVPGGAQNGAKMESKWSLKMESQN